MNRIPPWVRRPLCLFEFPYRLRIREWPPLCDALQSLAPPDMPEYLRNQRRGFDAYMDPSRFARHIVVRDKKRVATIYPAC